MPWGEKTVEEQREAFLEEAKAQAKSMAQLCREYGISRKTGYKWIGRAERGESLSNQSRRPHESPGKTDSDTEQIIVEKRLLHPAWGAKKLHEVLRQEGRRMPCVRTVHNILRRYGMVDKEESLRHQAFQRFEKEHCNDLWQTDFKGDFALGDGSRCYPLTILDDHSRYALLIDPKPSAQGVMESFQRVFLEYGKPDALLSDNGPQFAGFRGGYTRFERWLMDQDVLPIHGRPFHPQTQGKIERFHRSMKAEALAGRTFADLTQAKRELGVWRALYNEVRPHDALGGRRPAQVYEKSGKAYDASVKSAEYSGDYHVCKVNNWGYLRWMNYQVYLSETFADTHLEVRLAESQLWVCYRNFRIAVLDPLPGTLIHRRIARI